MALAAEQVETQVNRPAPEPDRAPPEMSAAEQEPAAPELTPGMPAAAAAGPMASEAEGPGAAVARRQRLGALQQAYGNEYALGVLAQLRAERREPAAPEASEPESENAVDAPGESPPASTEPAEDAGGAAAEGGVEAPAVEAEAEVATEEAPEVEEAPPAEGAAAAEETPAETAAEEEAPAEEEAAAEEETAAEEEAATEGGAAEGETGAAAGVEDAAPSSPEEDPAFQAVVGKTKAAAKEQAAHEPAEKKSSEAQSAAPAPANDVASQAAGAQVGKMAEQEAAPFDKEAFKAALKDRIAALSPKNLDEANNFKESGKAAQVKGAVSSKVAEGKEASQGAIEGASQEAPDPSTAQPKEVTPLPPTEPGAPPAPLGAAAAAPKAKSEAEVSLAEGPKEVDAELDAAEVPRQTLEESNEPEFTGALAKKDEAEAHSLEAPVGYRQEEASILAGAEAQAEGSAAAQSQAMHAARGEQFTQIVADQATTMTEDEQKRAEVAARIEEIYQATKLKVEERLQTLDDDVNRIFDLGAEAARQDFENYVDGRMRRYKSKRYSGLRGKYRWVRDKFRGLPDAVNVFYKEGRDLYLRKMDAVIDQVATAVETGLTEAMGLIDTGRQEVQTYVESLPQDLQKVGQEAAEGIQQKFDQLQDSVKEKEGQLIDSLAQKYVDNLKAVDARIEEMKAANRGLIDKALDAVKAIVKTILKLKDMLLSILAKAASVIGQIIKSPIRFVGNLVAGVKAGLDRFIANIGAHLKAGLMEWLFGALAGAGIQVPETLDAKGILSLVLQVLGLTYANIRARAVAIVGEPIVQKLEAAAEIFKILATEGPAGLWRFIKEKVGELKTMVLEGIESFIVERVIKAGITWILSLLNPASAFVKACIAIYDIVMFFVNRAAQIAALVNAVLDSIAAIASGAIGAMAAAVEKALAKAIPVVISFLASLLGLGGISEKIRGILMKVQAPVNKAIDWVIHKAVAMVKAVGGLFGGKKQEDEAGEEESDPEKAAKVEAGLAAIDQEEQSHLEEGRISREAAEQIAVRVRQNHPVFKSLTVIDGGETWDYDYVASPGKTKKGEKKVLTAADFNVGDEIQVKGKKWWHALITAVEPSFVRYEGDAGRGQLSYTSHPEGWRRYNPEAGFKSGAAWEAIKTLSDWGGSFTDAKQALNYRAHGRFTNPSGQQWHHIHERSAGGANSVTNLALTSAGNNQAFNVWFMQPQTGTGGVPLREWLKGRSAQEHREWGEKAIRLHGLSISTHGTPYGPYQTIP